MGLREQQRMLVRLYTDTSFREQFANNPQEVGQQFSLTSLEIEQLLSLPGEHLHHFASSLQNKRIGQIRKLLPLTCQQLEDSSLWLRTFATSYNPTGPKIHHNDAITFAQFLAYEHHKHPDGHIVPGWLLDLALYEAAWLECQKPTFRWMLRRYKYPVHKIRRDLKAETFTPPPPERTTALWLRLSRSYRMKHWLLRI